METKEELGARVQKEITGILINSNVKVCDINDIIRDFPYKWMNVPDRCLFEIRTELHQMTLKQYLEIEDAIRSIVFGATEEVRLLIASTASASVQE